MKCYGESGIIGVVLEKGPIIPDYGHLAFRHPLTHSLDPADSSLSLSLSLSRFPSLSFSPFYCQTLPRTLPRIHQNNRGHFLKISHRKYNCDRTEQSRRQNCSARDVRPPPPRRGSGRSGSRTARLRQRRRDAARRSPGATGPRRSVVADDAVTGDGPATVRRRQPLAGGRPDEVAGAARSAAPSPGRRRASRSPLTVRARDGRPAGARAAASRRERATTPAES